MHKLKTCEVCGWEWDPHPWTKCPRCAGHSKVWEPTQAEIRVACLAIQATWSKTVRRQRCAVKPVPVETHVATLVHYREDY